MAENGTNKGGHKMIKSPKGPGGPKKEKYHENDQDEVLNNSDFQCSVEQIS